MNQSKAFSKKGMLGGFIIVWSTLYVRHLFPVIYSVSFHPDQLRGMLWLGVDAPWMRNITRLMARVGVSCGLAGGRGSRLVGCESKIYGICTKNLGF